METDMTRPSALLILISLASASYALAQTPPTTEETPPTSSPDPSSASSPHQRQAMKSHEQMMKDCVAQQQAKDSSITEKAATKTCKDQMKAKTPKEY
jgi:hypothetical protein